MARAVSGGVEGHLMLGERVAPQSEVIRAIVLEDSPCCGGGPTQHGLSSNKMALITSDWSHTWWPVRSPEVLKATIVGIFAKTLVGSHAVRRKSAHWPGARPKR